MNNSDFFPCETLTMVTNITSIMGIIILFFAFIIMNLIIVIIYLQELFCKHHTLKPFIILVVKSWLQFKLKLMTIYSISQTKKKKSFREKSLSMDVGLTTPKGSKVRTELWMEQGIRLYIYPIVLLTGLTGNTLSIAILTRPAMRSLPTYTYLTLLSFTDNLVLLAHLLRLWIEALTGYDISLQHNWACKLKSLVGFTTTHYSGWLIVAMTVDRYMAVCRYCYALLVFESVWANLFLVMSSRADCTEFAFWRYF